MVVECGGGGRLDSTTHEKNRAPVRGRQTEPERERDTQFSCSESCASGIVDGGGLLCRGFGDGWGYNKDRLDGWRWVRVLVVWVEEWTNGMGWDDAVATRGGPQ